MSDHSKLRSLIFALILATCGMACAVVVHVPLLYRQGFTASVIQPLPAVRRVTFASSGEQVMVLSKRTNRLEKVYAEIVVLRGADSPALLPKLPRNVAPWISTCAERSHLGFIADENGELYTIDLRRARAEPQRIGAHQTGRLGLLHCTNNASLLIAGDPATLSGWDIATGACLWRRDEEATIAAAFLPDSERFFHCHDQEQLLELDPRSGKILNTWNSHCVDPVYLAFAKNSQRFVAMDDGYRCVISELGRSSPLWSVTLSAGFNTPSFSPDGAFILAVSRDAKRCVTIYDAVSGRLVGELRGAKSEIAGLAMAPNGVVYAWNEAGEIITWDLNARTLMNQFTPFGST